MNIGVIVLNYLAYSETIQCVRSFLKQDFNNNVVRIVVVDNCSDNDSYSILHEEFINEKNVSMNLKTRNNNQDVTLTYNCDFIQIINNAQLQCDTASNPINTTIEDLHLSNGQSDDGTFFTIEMLNWQTNKTQIIAENKISKSSGGLSGGAIAAIVIACVVFLIAIALVIIIV